MIPLVNLIQIGVWLSLCDLLLAGEFQHFTRRPGYILSDVKESRNLSTEIQCANYCITYGSDCIAYSFDQKNDECQLSGLPGKPGSQPGDDVRIYTASHVDGLTVSWLPTCRAQFLQPYIDVSLIECIQLHSIGATPDGDFSYDPVERTCYPVLPLLPDGFNCTASEIYILTYSKDSADSPESPSKISLSGPVSSSRGYYDRDPAIAFDGSYGNHWFTHPGITNPWIKKDIGQEKIIAGAKFYTRTNCCADSIENLHFLASTDESDLSVYNPDHLCSVYPGTPTVPAMRSNDIYWFPCSPKLARFIKFTVRDGGTNIQVVEIEIYGYDSV